MYCDTRLILLFVLGLSKYECESQWKENIE